MKTAKHPNMASESELSWMKRRTRIARASGGPRALSSLTDAPRQSPSAPAAPVGPLAGVGVGPDRRGVRTCRGRPPHRSPLASPRWRACVRCDAAQPWSALCQCGQRRARCAPDAPARARPLDRSEAAAWPEARGPSRSGVLPARLPHVSRSRDPRFRGARPRRKPLSQLAPPRDRGRGPWRLRGSCRAKGPAEGGQEAVARGRRRASCSTGPGRTLDCLRHLWGARRRRPARAPAAAPHGGPARPLRKGMTTPR